MINIKNARKLIADIDKILGTNEYRNYTLKGVSNLSYSDLEDLKMYAEFAITDQLDLLTPLRGNKAEVWDKYNVENNNV
jgi:hypothetical protein